jgi:hypothetical protein
MKKLYFLAYSMLFCAMAHAQITCPTSIKTSGQSTTTNPIFTVPNGQNGCSESWPATITVDGSLTYDYVSCSGGNLKYSIQSGTAPSTYEMTIDFGSGVVCSYDASGNLTVLSSEKFKTIKASIGPNPTRDFLKISLDVSNSLNSINIYSVSGRLVLNSGSKYEINISNLSRGLYIMKLETANGTLSRKIVKQ